MAIRFVAIGDEVLRGETREGNGAQLAQRLAQRGASLAEIRVISDEADEVAATLRALAPSSQLIVTSGGLGPTDDDGTRAALAALTGQPLQRVKTLADGIRARYARMGRAWIELNLKQAEIPTGATPLPNAHGTAPGFCCEVHGALIACLPGVPREVTGMLDDHLDTLLQRASVATSPVIEHCLRIFGVTESGLQKQLRDLPGYEDVLIRSLPSFPEIRLEIRSAPGIDNERAIAFTEQTREALGWRVFADDHAQTYAGALVQLLQSRGQTLAVAESCTGGLVDHLLTDVPGVSATLKAGVVSYSNEAKRDLLGVSWDDIMQHGAVSEPVARAMAEGARSAAGSDWAVATTGIAGPTGGSEDKPVGTIWIGVAGPAGATAHRRIFPGLDRWRFKRLAAWTALALLRRAMLQTRP